MKSTPPAEPTFQPSIENELACVSPGDEPPGTVRPALDRFCFRVHSPTQARRWSTLNPLRIVLITTRAEDHPIGVSHSCQKTRFATGAPREYHRHMRRIVAAALLALANLALVLAAVYPVTADSNLPACCRRLGKHACSMTSTASGPAFQAAACPLYPRGQAVPAQARANALPAPYSAFVVAISHPIPVPQTEKRYRIPYSRDGQKRGPPVSLS